MVAALGTMRDNEFGDYSAQELQNFSTFKVIPVIDYSVRALCAKPYYLHRRGCPKFGSGHPHCPPFAPLFDKYFDINVSVYAVINEFDMRQHVAKMACRNPTWSQRQLTCSLYWQPSARKQLSNKIDLVLSLDHFRDYHATICPEAMGVNVSKTLINIGIELEWPPINIARQVALIGKRVVEK